MLTVSVGLAQARPNKTFNMASLQTHHHYHCDTETFAVDIASGGSLRLTPIMCQTDQILITIHNSLSRAMYTRKSQHLFIVHPTYTSTYPIGTATPSFSMMP